MTLKEITEFQKNFDGNHRGKFDWNCQVTEDNIEMLEFLIVSIIGEVGEAANIVKKIARGDFKLGEKKEELQEEFADIFIYLIKISYQMGMDLEDAYLKKMKKNQERFQRYEKFKEDNNTDK